MNNAWADETAERPKLLGNSEFLRGVENGRQNVDDARIQQENLPSSLQIGSSEANQRRAEEDQRFKSSRLHARSSTAAEGDKRQQYAEETRHGTNPFYGVHRGTNVWQSIGSEDESLANIWSEMEGSPVASSKALPPPPLAEINIGMLVSIRAFANVDMVAVS